MLNEFSIKAQEYLKTTRTEEREEAVSLPSLRSHKVLLYISTGVLFLWAGNTSAGRGADCKLFYEITSGIF